MRTSRPVAEKLGTVREDPDLDGLLFTLISRATGDCQERAAQLCVGVYSPTHYSKAVFYGNLVRGTSVWSVVRYGTAYTHTESTAYCI